MNALAILALLILGAYEVNCRSIDDTDNSTEPERRMHGVLKMAKTPPNEVVQSMGTTTQIVCEVIGSPPPTVQWITGHLPLAELDDSGANLWTGCNPIVRVRAILVVDPLVAVNAKTFTCVGRTAVSTVAASTTVYPSPDQNSENLSEFLAIIAGKQLESPRKPIITYSHCDHIIAVGSDIVLPCRVLGNPRPLVYWMNEDGLIKENHPRLKMLPSGALLIPDLQWEDMGNYKCAAMNSVGLDTADTFVYPALRSVNCPPERDNDSEEKETEAFTKNLF